MRRLATPHYSGVGCVGFGESGLLVREFIDYTTSMTTSEFIDDKTSMRTY